jgi:hypothetical protein
MGRMKDYLIECQQLLAEDKYLELLQDCKTWEDPAEQLWAIVAWQVAFDHPEIGYLESRQVLVCPNHEGSFDCTPFCEVCEGKQEYEVRD